MKTVPTDILIYAFIAGVLIVWLRSLLGTKSGEERQRDNPFSLSAQNEASSSPLSNNQSQGMDNDGIDNNALFITQDPQHMLQGIVFRTTEAEEKFIQIMRQYHDFNPKKFVQNAKEAFALVVESFAAGDKEMLRDLLAKDVLESFERVIDQRKQQGEVVKTEVHAVRRAEIVAAQFDGRKAYITIRFTADETCVIRDSAGVIKQGNPDRVTEMVDVWTFGRDMRSRDPVWLVYETRDDVAEDHKTPLPESGKIW